jgi:hypothetical protein
MQGCIYEKSYKISILKKTNLIYIKLRKQITDESYISL